MTKRIINYAGAGLQDTDLLNMQRWLRYTDSVIVRAILGNVHSNSVVSGYTIGYNGNLTVTIAPGIHVSHIENEDAAYGSLPASSNPIRTLYLTPKSAVLALAAPTVAGQAINYLIYSAPASVDGDPSVLFYSDPSDPTKSRVFRGVGNNGVAQNTTRNDASTITLLAGVAAAAGSQATPALPVLGVSLYVITVTTGQTVIDGTVGVQIDPTSHMIAGLLEQHHQGGVNQAPQIDLTSEVQNKLPMANLNASDTLGIISAVQAFAGNPNGHVAGNQSIGGVVAPSLCWDSTNLILYACSKTGTSATAVWVAAANGPFVHQGTGISQLTNQIFIGWSSTAQLIATVDSTNLGPFAMLNVSNQFQSSVSVAGALSSLTAISTPGTIQSTGNMTTANQFSSGNGMITSGSIAIGSGVVTDPVVNSTNGILATPTGVINSYSGGSSWSTGSGVLHAFYSNGFVAVGSISTNGSSTAYNTTSDYRLKINVILLTGALDRIASVPVRRFGFIDQVSEENQDPVQVDGWFAHEMAVGVPEAVTGTKDATATHTNAVIGPNGGIAATGVTQAEWQAGMLPVAEVAAVPAILAQEAVPGTATTPAIPAQVAVPAVAYVAGRGPLYAAGSTWQATITVPVYQQIAQDKTAPVMWGGLQEARTRIIALEAASAAQAAAITALVAQVAALVAAAAKPAGS